ncbi:hypothetical protein B0H66DRAFT_588957 [Apodospora peruviana]|uniref:Uncharacterized protein n=1 Tax=Apodospora peruviana TaxID=516989 RepID=A0AAE0MBC8_9PEZI|nr:hypothetical protein B0H66DRAFT_588957 [Apodospora peruviana]
MSVTGSGLLPWEENILRGKVSRFFNTMNWTDGKLHISRGGKFKKANEKRLRQKEYFARAPERAAEQRAFAENPPQISLLQSPPASHLSCHFRRSGYFGSSPPRPPTTNKQTDRPRKRSRAASTREDVSITGIIRSLQQDNTTKPGDRSGPTKAKHDEEDLEQRRRKLLALKSWFPGPHPPPPVPARKRRRLSPTHPVPVEADRKARATLPHISNGQEVVQKYQRGYGAPALRRDDVKIRIGSQEKRLGDSSSIAKSSQPPPEASRSGRAKAILSKRKWTDGEGATTVRRPRLRRRSSSVSRTRDTGGIEQPRRRSRILTTSPLIFSPVPIRPVPSHIYSSLTYNSVTTNSAVAQVGRTISPVPQSQKGENNVWRNWLNQDSSTIPSDRAVEGSYRSVERPPVSPGISQMYRTTTEQIQSLPELDTFLPNKYSGPSHQARRPNVVLSSETSDSSLIPNPRGHLEFNKHPKRAGYLGSSSGSLGDFSRPPHAGEIDATKNISSPPLPLITEELDLETPAIYPLDAWKAFVFGAEDSDEVEETAFHEAKQDAARELQPSDSISATNEPLPDNQSDEGSESNETHNSEESNESTDSNAATAGDYDVASEFTDGSDSEVCKITSGSSSDPSHDTSDSPTRIPAVSIDSEMGTETVLEGDVPITYPEALDATSTIASLAVEPPRSEARVTEAAEQFRFAPRKLFIGSRSHDTHPTRPPAPVPPVGFARRRGRQKKRALDGRVDIRALPNYSSDPIEDIEDEDEVHDSRFGVPELDSRRW